MTLDDLNYYKFEFFSKFYMVFADLGGNNG